MTEYEAEYERPPTVIDPISHQELIAMCLIATETRAHYGPALADIERGGTRCNSMPVKILFRVAIDNRVLRHLRVQCLSPTCYDGAGAGACFRPVIYEVPVVPAP